MLGVGLGLARARRVEPGAAPLLLDALEVLPETFLALEKLKADYSGYSLRVRRSSDDAETDIGFDGLEPDVSAIQDFGGAGTVYASRVYDKTGNGNHWSQSIAASQPKVMEAGSLKLHGTKLVLSGGVMRLDSTAGIITGMPGASLVSLAATPNTSGYESLAWSTTASSTRTELGVGIGSGGLSRLGYFRVATLGTLYTLTGSVAIEVNELTLSILTADYAAGAGAMYTNGSSDGTRSIPVGLISDTSALISTPSLDISATVSLFGVFNSVLSSADRSALTAYALARKAA